MGISFESAIDIVNKNRALFSDNSLSSADFIDDDDDDEDEDDEDCYEDMGLVDDPSYVSSVLRHEAALLEKNAIGGSVDSGLLESLYGSSGQHAKVPLQRQDDVLDRPIRKYEIERASKSTFDDAELAKYRYERGLSSMGSGPSGGKLPVRRVDSGPSPSHRVRYDAYGSSGGGAGSGLSSSGMIRNQNHSNNSFSSSNVEIVLVNTGLDSIPSSVATSGIANSSGSSGSSPNVPTAEQLPPQKLPLQRNLNRNTLSQTQQQQSSTTLSRRELLCRSQGDEINSNYHRQHLQSASLSPSLSSANYQNVQYGPPATVAFHQQQPHSYNNNNNNNTIKSTSTSNNANSDSSNSLYNYVTQQQQQPYIPPAQVSLPSLQRVSSSYPDDFAQNYYNTTTPKGQYSIETYFKHY